jgi:SAM-dependent methyltransferase
MNYNKIKDVCLNIHEYLNRFLLANKDLEDNYYINGAKNGLTNKVNIYINYLNFLEISNFFNKNLNDHLKILDLGCGLGDKTIVLKNIFNNSEIYGLETTVNDDSLHKIIPPYKVFSRIYPLFNKSFGINLGLFDGYHLEFNDNFLDIILLYAVIEHIDPKNRQQFINNILKKVKPNGYIIITRCPRYYSLTEFISRKFKLGAHEWVLTKEELLNLFDKDLFDVSIFKRLSSVPGNPQKITDKIFLLLYLVDNFLSFIKWPFASDYFLIVKKK